MATVTIEVPDDAFAALRRSPKEFAQEMRVADAIHSYRRELISQEPPFGSDRVLAAHNAVGLAGESPVVGIDCLPT